ncbi:valine--tRNA ligase [Aquisalinus flavus]|uniref:Valine--tRNA ligase n=2 Tax=Aquisalinus flavus TaxID=1526572 RepID=A0A8J2V6R8_9PROT|nr:valine--tRNA ligase [Aquisalinus flavus]
MSETTKKPEALDHAEMERRIRDFWEAEGVYKYDPDSGKPQFSVDTPPPYVSAAHLHVGHAMSYSQAEFLVRYKRMTGHEIFYPMGFDDNGLPTERFVEQTHKVNKKTISRADFRALCMEETAKGAVAYEEMWRDLGLSIDWRLRYSTIDEHCRRTSQLSFIDLYKKGEVVRSDDPVLWDTVYDTALAQADLEVMDRKGQLFDIAFRDPDGNDMVISTTRPELIPGCVALYHHPDDERYKPLAGKSASVPIFDYDVPLKTSEDVDPEFGTGLMMCCTFGDGEDVKKWRIDKLDTRLVIGRDGKMTALAGKYEGMDIGGARKAIVQDLDEAGFIRDQRRVDQAVSVGERSGQPVEFAMVPQWFIKVLDKKEQFLKRSAELNWFPEHMKIRLDQWIEGLKYDWNISRQRFYGVPFPVWYVQETGDVILADEADLPVDPTEDAPPQWAQEKYAGMTIVGEPDVMDTWMTSSVSAQINANWAGTQGRMGCDFPLSLRVQAFEIIRTWLFYSVVKSDLHAATLPWQQAMISGWGLNEQGKKISKRDLEKFTDENGYNRYDPHSVIREYGADALRYWAAGARLGSDLRYHEKDVKVGRKLVIKMWNVARLIEMYLEGYDRDAAKVPLADRAVEDRWVLSGLDKLIGDVTRGFEGYDYAIGREALDKYFWNTLCDNYLEIVKERLRKPEVFGETSQKAAQDTLVEVLRTVLALFAPYVPFITEELYQKFYAADEGGASLHKSSWPEKQGREDAVAGETMKSLLAVIEAWRFMRTRDKIPFSTGIDVLTVHLEGEVAHMKEAIEANADTLKSALRARSIKVDGGTGTETNRDGLTLSYTVVEE